MRDGAVSPMVILMYGIPVVRNVSAFGLGISRRIEQLALGEDACNLSYTITLNTESKGFFYNLCCLRVNNPMVFILRIFDITVRRIGAKRFPGFALCLKDCSNLLTGILGIPFVDDVQERCEVAILTILGIDTVVDGDKADICVWKLDLGVHSYLQVISAKSAHIFHDDCSHQTFIHHADQPEPIRTVEVGTAVPVIYKELGVGEPVVICIFLQDGFLVFNAVAIALKFVITR